MSTVDDTAIAIADEYAEAALALAEEHGVTDTFLSELNDFVVYMQSDETFGNFMESPIIEDDERGEVLERTLRGKMSDLLLETILVLNRKRRAAMIPLFFERFRAALEHSRNEVEVLVTTAHPLTADLRARLSQALTERTGRRPQMTECVDASLIGGMSILIEDELLDDSVASHLQRMQRTFVERASRELHAGKLPVEE